MSAVNQLVKKISGIRELLEALKTAEKARAIELKAESKQLFESCYADFNRSQEVVNGIQPNNKEQSELHVLMAESAFDTEHYAIARRLSERFLQMEPQRDQYFCRVKLLLGLLINYESRHMNGTESIKWHRYAVDEVMIALDVATDPKNVLRYPFLIFNISVAFWKIAHQFLRPNRGKYFSTEIKRVVAALEEQNDADKEWRIMYLSAAAVCSDDEKNAAVASEQIDKACEHADALLQLTLAEEEKLNTALTEASQEKDQVMIAFRQIEDQEILRNKPPKIDPDAPPPDPNAPPAPVVLPPLEGLAAEGYDKVKLLLDASQTKKAKADANLRVVVERKNTQLETLMRLYMQRVSANANDAKRFITLPQVTKYIRILSLVTMQCMLVNSIPDKEWEPTLQQLVDKLKELPPSVLRSETLADLSRYAWRLGLNAAAVTCAELAAEGSVVSKVLRCKLDLCAAAHTLAKLDTDSANQVTGQRLSVKQAEGFSITKRLEAIKSMEGALNVMAKLGTDAFLVQEICANMWNAMIPLLQPHLRQRCHVALRSMIAALRQVSSPLTQLRMQVSYELAKCEDRAKALVMAKAEAQASVGSDYGRLDQDAGPDSLDSDLDRNRHLDQFIRPYVNLLELRCLVYDAPEDIEGQVLLWLQYAQDSKLKPYIEEMTSNSLFLMLDLFEEARLDAEDAIAAEKAAGAADESKAGDSGETAAAATGDGEIPAADTTSSSSTPPQPPRKPRIVLKKNAQGNVDFAALLLVRGPVHIDPVPLASLQTALDAPRTPDEVAAAGVEYTHFSAQLQTHFLIMYRIAKLGHLLGNVNILQQAATFVLKPIWDSQDPFMREFIDAQVHVFYLISDNMLVRIHSMPYTKPKKDPFAQLQARRDAADSSSTVTGAAADGAGGGETAVNIDEAAGAAVAEVDERCLGLQSAHVSEDIALMKRMVLQYLQKGVALALTVKDVYALQNGIIYFWNLHVNLFRQGLYTRAIEEVVQFIQSALQAIDALLASSSASTATPSSNAPAEAAFDQRLRLTLLETLSAFQEANAQLPQAIEAASKGANTATVGASAEDVPEYLRKRCCEQASRITLKLAASGGGGGKGGKGGGGGDPPVFGNAFLNVFSIIVQAEQPAEMNMPVEQAQVLVQKAIDLLEKDVKADMDVLEMPLLTQERFSQLVEMQAEAWTRLTRLRMLFGDTIGAQYTAERCLGLVAFEQISETDAAHLNPRVWRWVSVCERFFGLAIAAIIQPTGQDLSLQNELRIVALQHFTLACHNGMKAQHEQLVVDAATSAWNIGMPLVDETALRDRLYPIHREITTDLNNCKALGGMRASVDKLRQQFYLAMIEGYANAFNWDKALKIVMEAFAYVPSELQKPLWQWRVITLSKKGKSVLDGIQKLKEGDPSLQAQVFGILARASSDPQQQLESYMKAVEVLAAQMERVDYLLELAQWMGSTGIPSADITTVLQSALDALYEVEEQQLPEIANLDEEETALRLQGATLNATGMPATTVASTAPGGSVTASSSAAALQQQQQQQRRRPSNGGGTAASSRAPGSSVRGGGGASATGGGHGKNGDAPEAEDLLPERLDFKMLEQAARTLTMMGMLESQHFQQAQKRLEALHFIRKALQLWLDSLYAVHRKVSYAALSVEEREGSEDTPAIAFDTFFPERPQFLIPPEEPILFIAWLDKPKPEIVDLMLIATTQTPGDIPGKTSLPALQLSSHYLLMLAQGLKEAGYSKYALFVYAFLRMVLLYLQPAVAGMEAVVTEIHFSCFALMLEMGLSENALALPTFLPDTRSSEANDADSSSSSSSGAGAGAAGPLTVGNYLVQFASALERAPAPRHEKLPNVTSPFGFATWTPVLSYTGGFDAPVVLLRVCWALLYLGQLPQCHHLVLTLQKEFAKRQDERSLVEVTSILARIFLLQGRLEDAIALVLESRPQLEQSGDAASLAAHTHLLVTAYVQKDNLDEAQQVVVLAMELLQDVSVRQVDKKALQQQAIERNNNIANNRSSSTIGNSTAAATKRNLASSSATSLNSMAMARSSSRRSSTSNLVQTETSVASVTALFQVTSCYVTVVTAVFAQMIADNTDPRPLYLELCEKLSNVTDLIADVTGDVSPLVAQSMELRATAGLELLLMLHTQASHLVQQQQQQQQQGTDDYTAWVVDNVLLCVEYMEKVVDMRKQLADQIPTEDARYTSPELSAAAIASSANNVSLSAPYAPVSAPAFRALAMSQVKFSHMRILVAILKGEHASLTVNNVVDEGELSVVEKFLEVTKPPRTFEFADFVVPSLSLASQLLSEASRRLGEAADVSAHIDLLRNSAAILQQQREGLFDCMWRAEKKSSSGIPGAGGAGGDPTTAAAASAAASALAPTVTVGDAVLSEAAKELRNTLTQQAKDLIQLSDTQTSALFQPTAVATAEYLPLSCLALIEAYGVNRSAVAAMWLLQLHSARTSQWLASVWRNFALNPASAVAAAASRLQELQQRRDWPNTHKQPAAVQQIVAEQQFLNTASVAYRRLSFKAEPGEILRKCPTQCVYLCLQFCPLRQTLYCCAGVRTPDPSSLPAGANGSGSGSAPAKRRASATPKTGGGGAAAAAGSADTSPIQDKYWVIDKLTFDESRRRALQVILNQHKVWLNDATKFTTAYGESAPTDFDLAGTTSKYESRNLRKAERALEERLRALLSDMEDVFAPLLGPGSRVSAFVHALLGVNPPVPGDEAASEVVTPTAAAAAAAAAAGAAGSTTTAPHNADSNRLLSILGCMKICNPMLVWLVDSSLMSLPFEGLEISSIFEGRTCRDFSLHLMHHRIQDLSDSSGGEGFSTAGPTVSASSVRFVVDALREDSSNKVTGLERPSLSEHVGDLVSQQIVAGGDKWTPVRGANGFASLQDFIAAIDVSTQHLRPVNADAATTNPSSSNNNTVALLAYVLGRISGSLLPIELASLDLRQLALFMCIDLSQNDTSSRRQMSADVLKTPRQIQSEQPLNVAALLSLSGVGSLLLHGWSTPVVAQNRFLRLFFEQFAPGPGVPTGSGTASGAASNNGPPKNANITQKGRKGKAGGAAVPTAAAGASDRFKSLLAAVALAGHKTTLPTNPATKSAAAAATMRHGSVKHAITSIIAEGQEGEEEDGSLSVAQQSTAVVSNAHGGADSSSVAGSAVGSKAAAAGAGTAGTGAGADDASSLASSLSLGLPSITTTMTALPNDGTYPIKKWIRLSRLVYGVPTMTYAET